MNRTLLIIPIIVLAGLLSITSIDAWWWGQDTPTVKPAAKSTITHTQVHTEFYDARGNYYEWVLPIEVYEKHVIGSNFLSWAGGTATGYSAYAGYDDSLWGILTRDGMLSVPRWALDDTLILLEDDRGHTFNYQDFTLFSFKLFSGVIDDVYYNSYDNADFVWNVWHIASELTVYEEDVSVTSEGRTPIETFVRGGGDCEDLAILIADMLRSSTATHDWTINLVYMDGDSPSYLREINHVLVYASDGEYSYYIEPTAPPNWDYFPDGVDGYYIDFDRADHLFNLHA